MGAHKEGDIGQPGNAVETRRNQQVGTADGDASSFCRAAGGPLRRRRLGARRLPAPSRADHWTPCAATVRFAVCRSISAGQIHCDGRPGVRLCGVYRGPVADAYRQSRAQLRETGHRPTMQRDRTMRSPRSVGGPGGSAFGQMSVYPIARHRLSPEPHTRLGNVKVFRCRPSTVSAATKHRRQAADTGTADLPQVAAGCPHCRLRAPGVAPHQPSGDATVEYGRYR